ncbi:hypothetical protein BT69DRAFT_1280589 [Atractiella rhizophila]|nr:hypothetical protein BT69DRAFT_1280589 [Atractiella rhizophila]
MPHLACVSLVSFTVDSAGVPLLSQPPSASPPAPLPSTLLFPSHLRLSSTVLCCRCAVPRLRVMKVVRTEILGELVTEQARQGGGAGSGDGSEGVRK